MIFPTESTRRLLLSMVILLGGAAGSLDASAEPAERQVAQRLVIRCPLTGNAVQQYRSQILRLADRLRERAADAARPLLILELVPSESGKVTPFESALQLARSVMSDQLADIKTVAYLPQSIEGHAVLVALACEEIAMAPTAEIGSAGVAEDASRPIEPAVRAAYRQVAQTRRTASAALALAMVDRQAELLLVESDSGVEYLLAEEEDADEQDRSLVRREVLSPAGSMAHFTGREAREMGLARYLAKDRNSLAVLLGTEAGQLETGPADFADWQPVMIDLEGPLTPALARRIESLIGSEIDQQQVNWIGLRIDSSGGDWDSALRLAQTIAELDAESAHTIAYIPRHAEGPAALVALACEDLILQEGAIVAGSEGLPEDQIAPGEIQIEQIDEEPQAEDAVQEPNQVDAATRNEIAAVVATLRDELAPRVDRSWSLLAAVVDSELEVSRYRNRTTGEETFLMEEELTGLEEPRDWQHLDTLVAAGERLELTSERAEELGLSQQTVDQFDELAALYGFEAPPRTAVPNWALELVEALASPGFAAMLLVLGVVGLYVELSTPGLGIGGFLATLAFVLFFWSKALHGTADWLEVLLFVTGVVCLLVELLILPGVGIFGLGGGLLVVSSLVLASQTFVLPKTETQLEELRNSLGIVAGAGIVCVGVAMVLRQYLPRSPLFRRMMLMPVDPADRVDQAQRESLADFEHLVGQRGRTTTPLLPSGRAEVGGELVDVITDGEAIDPDQEIVVVAAHANRIVVKRSTDA